jgi:hypothetical protein
MDNGVRLRSMSVPTVSPVWLRHFRHVSTPGRLAMRNGSPFAGQTKPLSQRAFFEI